MVISLSYAVGIDLGGTKIEGVLADDKGKVYNRLRVLTEDKKGSKQIIDKIIKLVKDLSKGYKILGVGIGIPGNIDRRTNKVHNAPNNPSLDGVKLIEILKRRLKTPVFVENDANCLALSEAMFGAAKKYRNIVAVVIGTGLGGGIIIDGKLHQGVTPIAGEIGHMKIIMGGRKCSCGQAGCLEAYVSGTAIDKRYRELSKTKGHVTVTELSRRARKGDAAAKKILDETYEIIALGLSNIINVLDPEVFVIGGGVSNNDGIFREIPKRIAKYVLGYSDAKILKAKLGDSSGVLGAASLVFSNLSKK